MLMLSVKLTISAITCAWSFALSLSKIKERVFSFSLGVDTWQLAKVLVMKKNLSLCAVRTTFKSNILQLAVSNSSLMKK